jgi:AcrR family transcriptional regulator
MTRRAERRETRREEVLVAAMRLVSDEGLEALTIQRIAGAIGASVGGLYRYYDGKDALLVALQQRAIAQVADDQQADVERARGAFKQSRLPPEKGMAGVLQLAAGLVAATVVMRNAYRRPEEHRLLDAFLSSHQPVLTEESARLSDETLKPLVETVARELEGAAASGTLERGDAVQRTYVLWAALHGLDHFRKRDRILPPSLRVDALVPATLRAIVRGWGASEGAAAAATEMVIAFERDESRAQSDAKQ